MKYLFFAGAILALLPLRPACAQSTAHRTGAKPAANENLTNRQIIALTAAGLPPDVIVAKITSSATAFDLSTNGLLALKQSKVDDAVLKAMLAKASASRQESSAPGWQAA